MQPNWMKKTLYYVVLAAFLSGATAAAYFGLAHFLADRQTALSQLTRPRRTERPVRTTETRRAGETRTVNGRPVGASAPAPQAQNAGEAAIQRQLKTLDEINRINEMNRRLQEQQRRIQNQR